MTDDDDWIGPWPAGALPVTSNHWPSTKGTHPMTDAINLAERQEIMADSFDTPAVVDTCRRTAARLRQQQARIAELEAALRPFAEASDDLDEHADDKHHIWEAPAAMGITAGHLRAARKALTP